MDCPAAPRHRPTARTAASMPDTLRASVSRVGTTSSRPRIPPASHSQPPPPPPTEVRQKTYCLSDPIAARGVRVGRGMGYHRELTGSGAGNGPCLAPPFSCSPRSYRAGEARGYTYVVSRGNLRQTFARPSPSDFNELTVNLRHFIRTFAKPSPYTFAKGVNDLVKNGEGCHRNDRNLRLNLRQRKNNQLASLGC
jgi:hypothetical protein